MRTSWNVLWQRALIAVAVVALLVVALTLAQIALSPVLRGRPARVVSVSAGPYELVLTLYSKTASAGSALPFALAPAADAPAPSRIQVSAVPGDGVQAVPIRGELDTSQMTADGWPGDVNITVRGPWTLHIVVAGPLGDGAADVPITATAPPPIPLWLGWGIGLAPVYALLLLAYAQWRRRSRRRQATIPRPDPRPAGTRSLAALE